MEFGDSEKSNPNPDRGNGNSSWSPVSYTKNLRIRLDDKYFNVAWEHCKKFIRPIVEVDAHKVSVTAITRAKR